MTWRTHALFGADCALCWSMLLSLGSASSIGTPQPDAPALLVAVAAFGALLPDLDASESKVRHVMKIGSVEPFAIVGDLAHGAFGHRGFMHSATAIGVVGALLVAICACLDAPWQVAVALVIGYASHIAADACTPAGVPLLFPWRRKRFHLLPKDLRITTGSAAEDALMVLLALPIVLALLPGLIGMP